MSKFSTTIHLSWLLVLHKELKLSAEIANSFRLADLLFLERHHEMNCSLLVVFTSIHMATIRWWNLCTIPYNKLCFILKKMVGSNEWKTTDECIGDIDSILYTCTCGHLPIRSYDDLLEAVWSKDCNPEGREAVSNVKHKLLDVLAI